jgi:hypothetical protein
VLALVLLTIVPPLAAAAPVQDPAVDQYVESVPGVGGGDRTPRDGGGRGGDGLPSGVQHRVQQDGGADAAALKAVGSSPELGAPRKSRAGAADLPHGSGHSQSALGAAASAVSGDGNAGGWLLAGIAALTAALAATALARRSLTR